MLGAVGAMLVVLDAPIVAPVGGGTAPEGDVGVSPHDTVTASITIQQ